MKKHFIIALAALAASAWSAGAQSRGALKINEVMTQNVTNYVDDFGNRGAWIELFNSAYAPLEISSVFITTDPKQPKMYPVPLGDVNTKIPKRQHVVFWADSQPTRGTFHTSFVLDPEKENWIGIYDANGKTLIDSVTVPVLAPDTSWARAIDGKDKVLDEDGNDITWGVRDNLSADSYVTPSSNNMIEDTNGKVDKFHEMDKNGFALTVMAMCIVFSALLVLCLSFIVVSKIFARVTRARKMKAQGMDPVAVPRSERPDHDSGEEIAAIAMALRDHLEAHDTENTILTINKVKKAYSPWSSKIYSMRELPRR